MSYLIKSPHTNEISIETLFSSSDNKDKFKNNKLIFGKNWIWHDKPIQYRFNSHGYRMDKEFDAIDSSNYIAFFGCSFTVGTGMPLEDTYPYRVSKSLNVDYINGGIIGASCDFVFHNIVHLLSSTYNSPKAIIINWPEISRTFYWINNVMEFYLVNRLDCNSYWNKAYKSFVMERSHINNRFIFMRQVIIMLCNLKNIKLLEFTIHQEDLDGFVKEYKDIILIEQTPEVEIKSIYSIDFLNKYCARDVDPNSKEINRGSHPGYYFQLNATEKILHWYNK